MKILVIEDQQQLLDSIKKSLEKEDYLVETVTDYYDALERVFIYNY